MPPRSYNQAACFALWIPAREQVSVPLSAAFPPTDSFSVTVTLLLERLSGTILEVPGAFSIDVAGETISMTIGDEKTVLDPERFPCPRNTWFSLGVSVDRGVPSFAVNGIPERFLGALAEAGEAKADVEAKAGDKSKAEGESPRAALQGSSLVIARDLECYVEGAYLYPVALDENALQRNQLAPSDESVAATAGCRFASGETELSGTAQALSLEGSAAVVDVASVLWLGEDGVAIPLERRGALDPSRFPSNAYTVTARIFPTPSEQSESVICTTGFDAERSFTFEVCNGPEGRRLRVRDRGVELAATAKLPLVRWVDAAVVFDGKKLALFQQGEQVGEATGPARPEADSASEAPGPLSIGNYEEGGWGFVGSAFCGYLDRIAVFSAALEAGRIASLRQTLPSRFSENIEALYDFSDGRAREHVGGGALALLGPAEVVWQKNTVNSAELGALAFENPEIEGTYSGFEEWQLRVYVALLERYGPQLLGGELDLGMLTARHEGYTTAAAVDLVERTLSEPITRQAFLELYRQADLKQRAEAAGGQPAAPGEPGEDQPEGQAPPTKEGSETPGDAGVVATATATVASSVLAGLGMVRGKKYPNPSGSSSSSSSPYSSPQVSRSGSDEALLLRYRGVSRSPEPAPYTPAVSPARAGARTAGGAGGISWWQAAIALGVTGAVAVAVATKAKRPQKTPSRSKACSLTAITFATKPAEPRKSALATARTSAGGARKLDDRPGWVDGEDRSAIAYVRDAIEGREDIELSFEITFATTNPSVDSVTLTFSAMGTKGPLSAIDRQTATLTPNEKQTVTCTARAYEAKLIALGKSTQELNWTLSVTAKGVAVTEAADTSFDVHVLESTPIAPFALDPQKPETLLSADLLALCDLAWKHEGDAFPERAARLIDADADGRRRIKAAITPAGDVSERYCEGAGAIDDDFRFDVDALSRDMVAATDTPVACGSCDAALLVATLARAQGGDVGICAFGSHEELAGMPSSALIVAEGTFAGNVACRDWTPLGHYYAPLSWSEEDRRDDRRGNLFVYDGFFAYGEGSSKHPLAGPVPFAPDRSPLSTGPQPITGRAEYYRDAIAPAGANAAPWLTPVFAWTFGSCATRDAATNEAPAAEASGAAAFSAPRLAGIAYKGSAFAADQARPAFSAYTRERLATPGQCTIICHSISFATMRGLIVNALNSAVRNHDSAALHTTIQNLFDAVVGPGKGLGGTELARYTAKDASLSAFLLGADAFIIKAPGTTAADVGIKASALLTNLNDALYNLRAGTIASCEWNPSLKDCFDVREWAYVGKDGMKRYASHRGFYDSLTALRTDIGSSATLPKQPKPGFYLLDRSDGERLRLCRNMSSIPPLAVGKNAGERSTPLLYSSSNVYFEPPNLSRVLLDANAGKNKSSTNVFIRTATGTGWERL